MKLRVLLGTLALSLAVAALVPASADAASRHSRHRNRVRVYETYRSPYAHGYAYDRYDRSYGYDYRYGRSYRYDPYYYDDDYYYRSYAPRVYVPYRSYRYYRPYRPLLGVRVGGPRFGVWVGW